MISIVVAASKNGVIGKNNSIPWRLRDDMRHFASLTKGANVIMGRKTYESILARLGKPLPGRTNIVITRQKKPVLPGCIVVNSIEGAIKMCQKERESFIIGGEMIYNQAIDFVDNVYLTEVETEDSGDAFFPLEKLSDFNLVVSEKHAKNEFNEFAFDIKKYSRLRTHK